LQDTEKGEDKDYRLDNKFVEIYRPPGLVRIRAARDIDTDGK